jgi:carboxypeptidase C (cathepsin A)
VSCRKFGDFKFTNSPSYGGHYGPTFAAHFLRQNAAIKAGLIKGKKLNLKVLGIGNGLTVIPKLND